MDLILLLIPDPFKIWTGWQFRVKYSGSSHASHIRQKLDKHVSQSRAGQKMVTTDAPLLSFLQKRSGTLPQEISGSRNLRCREGSRMKWKLSGTGLKGLLSLQILSCSGERGHTWQGFKFVSHPAQCRSNYHLICNAAFEVDTIYLKWQVDKVTVYYECKRFSREAWRIWQEGSSPFFYDTCKISNGAMLHLPLDLEHGWLTHRLLPLYI